MRVSVADQVFKILQHSILSLDLPPAAKISEADIARRMGVSRQPVREAFKRLERLGFLQIRPQSGTIVSLISEEAVLRARFIRLALEVQTVRAACAALSAADMEVLEDLIREQETAIAEQDGRAFHHLDEEFHRSICALSGHDYVWDLINDQKAHMDRVRMLSLIALPRAVVLSEHQAIVAAISQRDPDAAAEAMTRHLSRIEADIARIKAENHGWFVEKAR